MRLVKLILLFTLVFLLSSFALGQTTGTASCSPLSTMDATGLVNTDNGKQALVVSTGCSMSVIPGATGYFSTGWMYIGTPITLQNDITISLVTGRSLNPSSDIGSLFVLEVTTLTVTKRFEMARFSYDDSSHRRETWPITLTIPRGSTIRIAFYGYANDVSSCSAGCLASARFVLQ